MAGKNSDISAVRIRAISAVSETLSVGEKLGRNLNPLFNLIAVKRGQACDVLKSSIFGLCYPGLSLTVPAIAIGECLHKGKVLNGESFYRGLVEDGGEIVLKQASMIGELISFAICGDFSRRGSCDELIRLVEEFRDLPNVFEESNLVKFSIHGIINAAVAGKPENGKVDEFAVKVVDSCFSYTSWCA